MNPIGIFHRPVEAIADELFTPEQIGELEKKAGSEVYVVITYDLARVCNPEMPEPAAECLPNTTEPYYEGRLEMAVKGLRISEQQMAEVAEFIRSRQALEQIVMRYHPLKQDLAPHKEVIVLVYS